MINNQGQLSTHLDQSRETYKRVLIAAPEVQAITLIDCGEELVEIKESSIVQNLQTSKESLAAVKCIYIRQTIREKLLKAETLLPDGLRLQLHEGYISLDRQKEYFDEKLALVRKDYPELSLEGAFIETTKLASPITNLDGTINIPPHSTGAAVDVDIINDRGISLDFGMAIKDWAITDPSICETRSEKISLKARENRQLLFDVMTEVGFVNYFTEWWHFSYGDKYWAFQLNQKNAIYGCCDNS